jgi:hypothetical protein
MRHFIIFRRTDGHCGTWLVRSACLRNALTKYAIEEYAAVERDSNLLVSDGYGGEVVYSHPLACIEAQAKTWSGGAGWNGWEIRELFPQHFEAEFAEVFCSENPAEIEDYIALCRPLLRKSYPRSRARAFVWYLKDGPLVTFYRFPRQRYRDPLEILGRYHLRWQEWQPQKWEGTYDDILEQMAMEYPLP